MGMGLFSLLDFHEQDVIAVFKWDMIYEREYQELKMLGKATYVVEVIKGTYLNCKASLAKVPRMHGTLLKVRELKLIVGLLVTPEIVSES